jgi:hypothetical protein
MEGGKNEQRAGRTSRTQVEEQQKRTSKRRHNAAIEKTIMTLFVFPFPW